MLRASWVPVQLAEGLSIWLHPSGAAFLPEHAALLVADAHLGKAASFRRLGVPVPSGSTATTLEALGDALASLGGTPLHHLVFLGDLLHAARGRSPELSRVVGQALTAWRARRPGLCVHLVRGNHDRAAGDPPPEWDMALQAEPWPMGPWALCHEPQLVAGAYTLAGHLHPCIGLRGGARERLRLPCFWFGDPAHHAIGVLPAFGDFTGMHPIQRRAGDRVWAVADQAVRELPEALR
ncbi:ligase-associated DNA damage response endonuclease PdeM [Hydrogenophaga sp.]|uniref:ligase-associated DNA damage response endonuclease PdeM n=1 Tax=Hydrogenophaga sp. TaxID=1904254 RepID=UPI003AF47838